MARVESWELGSVLRPVCFKRGQSRIVCKAVIRRQARKHFNFDFAAGNIFNPPAALRTCFGNGGPDGKPRRFGVRRVFEAECKCGAVAKRQNGGEQIEFLRRHLGKAVEPEALNCRLPIADCRFGAKCSSGQIQQTIGVLQIALREPARIVFGEQREIGELVAEFAAQILPSGERAEPGWRELVPLKFGEQRADLLRKTGTPRAAANKVSDRLHIA